MESTNKLLQKLLKDRPTDATEETKKEKNEEGMSNTKYYEEVEELTNSLIEQKSLANYLSHPEKNEPQSINIDEEYLIDIPKWGEPINSIEFDSEEEDWNVGSTYGSNMSSSS
ncbi:hypothetical protein C2G38_2219486 [Gigaspora rosea]|uniref:Uncharacterized protein n=1 Tax=Gigaspora rosea TaxID=44941 RepID=A0A397U5F5_9GLOM|nr:hypothetical protein C2G38_2219486 [Gigaspora rosea]